MTLNPSAALREPFLDGVGDLHRRPDDDPVPARTCKTVQQSAQRRVLPLDDAGDHLQTALLVVRDIAGVPEQSGRHGGVEIEVPHARAGESLELGDPVLGRGQFVELPLQVPRLGLGVAEER